MVLEKAKLGLWLLLWSCTTTSVYAVSQEDLDYGLKIFFRVYEASSWFEGKKDPSIEPFSRWISTSGRESIEEQLKGYPADTKVESYKSWFFNDNGAFPRHPEDYKKECSNFAQNPFGKPSVDESQCLKDDGKDYPFKALSHCIINQMRKRGGDKIIETWLQRDAPNTSNAAVSQEDLDYGLKIFFRALEATSWFEGEHDSSILPNYRYISNTAKNNIKEQLKPYPVQTQIQSYQAWFFNDYGPYAKHPEEYKKECSKFAEEPFEKPTVDESKILEDAGRDYPFKALSHCIMNLMRKRGGDNIFEKWLEKDSETYSASAVVVSQEDLDYGLKMFFRALNVTTRFEGKQDSSIYSHYEWASTIALQSYEEQMKKFPVQFKLKTYQSWLINEHGPLAKHPEEYRKECSKFAQDAFVKPIEDESKILEDEGKQYPFQALSYCLLSLMRKRAVQQKADLAKLLTENESTEVKISEEDLDYAFKIFFRAYEATCWYEGGFRYPFPHDADMYQHCRWAVGNFKNITQVYLKPQPMKVKLEHHQSWFFHEHGPFEKHPNEYKKECSKFAEDVFANPSVDESQTLEDDGKDYPFKALSYCITNQMRQRGGEQTIEAWKKDRFHNTKDWRLLALERHNRLRAAHGSPPLTMTDQLNQEAQEWSNGLSQKCVMDHAPYSILFKYDFVGENLATSVFMNDSYMEALWATNQFYAEIHDYCYPDMFDENGSVPPGCMLNFPEPTGHFTQMIWKETKEVGFGRACTFDCADVGSCFFTVRYLQMGNTVGVPDAFKNNVQRPTY